jgi:hypothetical protein
VRYLIEYTAYTSTGCVIKTGTVRSSDVDNSFTAKVKFEEHCKRKYQDFDNLIIHSCEEDFDIMDFFKDIFK